MPSTKDTQLCSECGGPGRRELPALLQQQSVFTSVSLSRISYFSSGTERFPPHPWHRPALAMMPPPAAQDLCLGPRGMTAGSFARVSWKGVPPGPCPAPPCLRISEGAHSLNAGVPRSSVLGALLSSYHTKGFKKIGKRTTLPQDLQWIRRSFRYFAYIL